jgi:hypothetical protein
VEGQAQEYSHLLSSEVFRASTMLSCPFLGHPPFLDFLACVDADRRMAKLLAHMSLVGISRAMQDLSASGIGSLGRLHALRVRSFPPLIARNL